MSNSYRRLNEAVLLHLEVLDLDKWYMREMEMLSSIEQQGREEFENNNIDVDVDVVEEI